MGYEPVEEGYRRITPESEDIAIGSFETIYAGELTEISRQGLATVDDIVVDNPQTGDVVKVGSLRFYYIATGRLIVEDRGPLDLSVPAQRAISEHYFGPERHSRKATKIETFDVQELRRIGYTNSDWALASP